MKEFDNDHDLPSDQGKINEYKPIFINIQYNISQYFDIVLKSIYMLQVHRKLSIFEVISLGYYTFTNIFNPKQVFSSSFFMIIWISL